MKREIKYFMVGDYLGGSQSFLKDPAMNIAGCAAVTACDLSVFLGLYPFGQDGIKIDEYAEFTKIMKPYLKPRFGGISELDIYIDGYKNFLKDNNHNEFEIIGFSGEEPFDKAKEVIKKQIDKELPIPYLQLKHRSFSLRFFNWHWFMIAGYEEKGEDFFVKAITYGSGYWLDLKRLWNTGKKKKGGMIIIA